MLATPRSWRPLLRGILYPPLDCLCFSIKLKDFYVPLALSKLGRGYGSKSFDSYRLQTKFAKVMFSQVSVLSSQTPPPGRVHPLGRYTPWAGHPSGQLQHCTGIPPPVDGQQAGGPHPTGM